MTEQRDPYYEGKKDPMWLTRVAEHFTNVPGSKSLESILAPQSWYLKRILRWEKMVDHDLGSNQHGGQQEGPVPAFQVGSMRLSSWPRVQSDRGPSRDGSRYIRIRWYSLRNISSASVSWHASEDNPAANHWLNWNTEVRRCNFEICNCGASERGENPGHTREGPCHDLPMLLM
jgi:hypothetical protein